MNEYNLSDIIENNLIHIVGENDEQKKQLIKNILVEHEKTNKYSIFIFTDNPHTYCDIITAKNKNILNEFNDTNISNIKDNSVIIFDNIIVNAAQLNNLSLQIMCMKAFHANNFIIFSTNSFVRIPLNILNNIDIIFLLYENNYMNLKRMYVSYAKNIYSYFIAFFDMYTKYVKDNKCMVINKKNQVYQFTITIFMEHLYNVYINDIIETENTYEMLAI